MNWYKIAKHASNNSHQCIYCDDFLKPIGFSENNRHHFNWGIVYKCSCGKSGLWTNSIRGPKEFISVVYKNVPPENNSSWQGFCNDLFCPFCFSYVPILINGLYLDTNNKPIAYVPKKQKLYYLKNYDKYIINYNTNAESVKNFDPEIMGEEAEGNDIVKSVDISGCQSLKHNLGIIRLWQEEYQESEYKPIYEWIKANKNKIPGKMIQDFKNELV